MELANAVSVVTGGSSGLGEAAVRRLADFGGQVVVLDLAEGEDPGLDGVHKVTCDVSDPAAVASAMDWVGRQFGQLHVCVNAAGVPDSARMIDADGCLFPLETFRRVIEINLIGTFDVMRHAVKLMAASPGATDGERGVIINVASAAALQGQVGQVAYSASKAGVLGMMLPAARDLASLGIRVVTVSPGLFETGMAGSLPRKVVDRLRAQALYPMRAGDPDEFAALVCHIAENRYVNGANMALDAGLRMG